MLAPLFLVTPFDPLSKLLVTTQAFSLASGAVLERVAKQKLRTDEYVSKTISAAKCNYPFHERKLLAIPDISQVWRIPTQSCVHHIYRSLSSGIFNNSKKNFQIIN